MVTTKKPTRSSAGGTRGAPPRRGATGGSQSSRRPSAARPHAEARVNPADLREVFAALKGVLARHARHLLVVFDTSDEYTLHARKPGAGGAPVLFGTTELRATHVRYELMPLQLDPALVAAMSPALRRHLQGPRMFSFTQLEPAVIEELDLLTRAGMAAFTRKGLA